MPYRFIGGLPWEGQFDTSVSCGGELARVRNVKNSTLRQKPTGFYKNKLWRNHLEV